MHVKKILRLCHYAEHNICRAPHVCALLPPSNSMALGPIGPFCPFRGKGGFEEIDREMGLLSYQAGDLARQFQGITTGLTGGMMPDKDAVKQLADEMCDVNGAPSSRVRICVTCLKICAPRTGFLKVCGMSMSVRQHLYFHCTHLKRATRRSVAGSAGALSTLIRLPATGAL